MRLTEKVHQLLSEHLKAGDLAIDATAGNGHDTRFLARQVGESGQVIAIDIQAGAIASTRERLEAAGCEACVHLLQSDHAEELESLAETEAGTAAAVVFNLGYLPGSDHFVQTLPANTLRALHASARLLFNTGLLCVTAYQGHPGGEAEATAVEDWMHTRAAEGWQVERHLPPSENRPPILWVATKPCQTLHTLR